MTFLQLAVRLDARPLGTIGEQLPALAQLKLSGSNMPCIRELGTSLGTLRVLWLSRCGLADLDGLGALPQLSELYLAFNDVSRLMPLQPLEQLQVLDLEANNVTSMDEVAWLQFLPSLQELTLRANPVADDATAAAGAFAPAVFALLPSLATLDDETRDEAAASAAAPGGADVAAAGWAAADDECPSPAAAAAAAAAPPAGRRGVAAAAEESSWRRRSNTPRWAALRCLRRRVRRRRQPRGGGVRPATAGGCGTAGAAARRRGRRRPCSSPRARAPRLARGVGIPPARDETPPQCPGHRPLGRRRQLAPRGDDERRRPRRVDAHDGRRDHLRCAPPPTPPHPLPSLPHAHPSPFPRSQASTPPPPQAQGVGARSGRRSMRSSAHAREQLVFVAADARGAAPRHATAPPTPPTPGRGGDGGGGGRFRGGRDVGGDGAAGVGAARTARSTRR